MSATPAEPQYGLIFDVDGVIADTEAVNALVTASVLNDLFGIADVVRLDFDLGVGRGAAEYVRAAARVHGVELDAAQIERATAARQDAFLDYLAAHHLPAFPGVLDVIAAAEADPRFSVAIATSSTRQKSEAVLRSSGVPFERLVYITGSDVIQKKPHPELFLKAAAGLGLNPTMCVVVEDAPNGIAAAKAAGATCVAVTNSFSPEALQEADLVVDGVDELSVDWVAELIDVSL